ncbi:MAG: PHP domain-containing protein [Sandaracinaceae bacterium]|nr:PHP domain-containing protein [Myxococcales bacterium]MCB9656956.1 PHP domain-containing protein [Sandaracinaceae bacterium]
MPRARHGPLALGVLCGALVVAVSGSSGQASHGTRRGPPAPVTEDWPRLLTVVPDGTYAAFGVDGHAHSSISRDARLPPPVVAELASQMDLDALVLTDHGGSHGAEVAQRADLLVLPGVEVGGEFGHAVVWGTRAHAREYRKASNANLDATAALAHADGAIIALAHPGWWISRHQYDPRMWMDRDALRRGGIAEGLDALELWNGVYPRYTEALLRDWVDLWEAGNEVPIVGNSDFHRRAQHHLGTPRTFVLCPVPPGGAPSLDRACVLDAARRGRSYLSQGPAIAWSANGRIAGERIVAAPGELIRLTVEVKLRDALGEPLLEVLRGNEVVETRPLPNLHTRHEVRVTMPDHDTPLWLRVAYGTYDYSTPPFALVTNPITLDVPPARTDTREAAGGSLARRRYALGAESRSHWAADRWVRDRLQALVLQDRSGRIQRVGARRRIARAR